MLIPISTDRPSRRKARITPALILLNIVIHIAVVAVGSSNPDLLSRYMNPMMVWGQEFHWYSLFTSAFLHGGLMHLSGNMLFLWVFGPPVEDRLGRVGFTAFYLLAAAASGGLHAAFSLHPAIGASGAIAGVTGAFLVLFPRTRIRCFMMLFIIGFINVPAWWLIGLQIAMNLFAQGFGADNNVANLAHLGGYAFGFTVALTLLATRLLAREPYDLFSMTRQAKRRRDFRAAGLAATQTARVAAEKPLDPKAIKLAADRAMVSQLISSGSLDQAAEAFDELSKAYPDRPAAATLPRNTLYTLGNHLVASGKHALAADAYERFLDAYPTDREAPEITLMLGRLKGRYLGERAAAIELLTKARDAITDQAVRAIALDEINHLKESSP